MHTSKTLFGLLTALVFVFGMESTAYGQTPILQEFEKLNASNDTQDRFGQNSAIYVDTAIVGAYDVDINGIHSGAAFIYRFDGNTWVEEPILLPSQSSAYAYFGWDVSISGDVAVVSAPGDKVVFVFQFDGTNWNESANISLNNSSNDLFGWSVSVDVNRIIVGAPGDNVNGSTSGVAYIFEYDGISWNQQAHLIPSNGSTEDFFGGSVSISGDRALVGAGEQPGTGGGSGTAYIYEYDGTTWNNESILTPSNGNNSDYFGQAVSLQGDVAVIGSMQFYGAGNQSGAAYVYRYDGNDWDDETVLRASDSVIGQFFGASVCTSDEIIIVGAIGDATSGVQTGAAYVFWYDYTSNTWNEQVKLLPSDAESGDWFGQSVGVHEGTAIVCSWYEDDNGTDAGAGYLYHVGDLDGDSIIDGFDNCIDIFNPNQEDCNANGVGDVCDLLYPATFDCNNNGLVDSCELYTFDIETKILASDGGTYDRFGISVAVDGDTVVVGADGDDDNGSYSGSAYIYRFDGSSWIETKLIASDGASNEYFGYSVAVDGDTVVVGAYRDDDYTGSAYVYRSQFVYSEDCNANGVPDECDIEDGTSNDVNGNGIPDECEVDCNGNGVPDHWDIKKGTSEDCNTNGIPDECDIDDGTSTDWNGNGIPDECEIDCNTNGYPDDYDIKMGWSEDVNGDGVPDECQCIADITGDNMVNVEDLLAIIGYWGSSGPLGDVNSDGIVDVSDLLIVVGSWGPCE